MIPMRSATGMENCTRSLESAPTREVPLLRALCRTMCLCAPGTSGPTTAALAKTITIRRSSWIVSRSKRRAATFFSTRKRVPELPEVETVVRTLAPKLTGRRMIDAQFFSHHVVRQNFATLRKRVRNQTVRSVRRHGKFIVLELDQGILSIHLGMTGKLLMDAQPGRHARAIFQLDEGLLVYDDIRHFGRIEWSPGLLERAAQLGPDALDIPL